MNLYSEKELPKATFDDPDIRLVSVEDEYSRIMNFNREDYPEIHEETVVYSCYSGEEQTMTVFYNKELSGSLPVAVYIPGSGWRRQGADANEHYMLMLAKKGYFVARVLFRPSEVEPFPAHVIDVKNALKFLIGNKDKYNIDIDRIGLLGDSSGAHTALMVGITGNGYPSDNELYPGIDFDVKCIVDQFGPTEIKTLNEMPSCYDITSANELAGMLIGRKNVWEHPDEADIASPLTYITKEGKVPPVLILHGNMDPIVPFGQSLKLWNKLKEYGKTAEFVCYDNGTHWGFGFHSMFNLKLIGDYLDKYLK